ncbi:MAG: hypothetical protein DCF30_02760 [Hyphomicrobiales bacterium]|nr:MAG: hypothetical protein DCF30_02760 [Hyphomicrobiales bacterium]
MAKLLVDGRVFSTAAFDRGMGRYVTHLLDQLRRGGHEITILIFRSCKLAEDSSLLSDFHVRFANYEPELYLDGIDLLSKQSHSFTAYISELIATEGYDSYIDTTPFIGPLRFDIFQCPVIVVCYDLIPLKHPQSYLTVDLANKIYYNGLARLSKADHIVCISQTAADELSAYLGIPPERMTVVAPCLEDRYRVREENSAPNSDRYIFAILGHHKSKNPSGSIRIFKAIDRLGLIGFKINSPTPDQMEHIKSNIEIPERFHFSASISDEEKFVRQLNATVVAHLSLEEGFGIPLLEALFLGRKILALDIAINRELLSAAGGNVSSCVYLIPPTTQAIDLDAIADFIESPADPDVFASIRQAYESHWALSPSLLDGALTAASKQYTDWYQRLIGVIFSSVPGTNCGVADYSVAYVRSAAGNMVFFFAEGEQEFISYLTNVRVCTYLDFERFQRTDFGSVPSLFNFAFSPALHPGIKLMLESSKPGDVALIHERRYFDGIVGMEVYFGSMDEALFKYVRNETSENKDALARRLAYHPALNLLKSELTLAKSPISAAWLKSLPVRPVSHLAPSVLDEMASYDSIYPGSIINDLEEWEDEFVYVPMGIDDRHHPALLRGATRLRTSRGIQQDDIVIGQFGLIIDDTKKIWEVSSAFIAFAKERQIENDGRRAFFFLVGRIVDQDFFNRISQAFAEAGLDYALVHSNPVDEIDFETEMVACDAIACFRIQVRGQQSHVYVRALSLATPILVNRKSGFGYDPDTTIDDDHIEADLKAAFARISQRDKLVALRQTARRMYDTTHRGDASLQAILDAGAK